MKTFIRMKGAIEVDRNERDNLAVVMGYLNMAGGCMEVFLPTKEDPTYRVEFSYEGDCPVIQLFLDAISGCQVKGLVKQEIALHVASE